MGKEDFKLIFTGSVIQANYLEAYLNENNIPTMIEDSYESSLRAGWVSGSQEDGARMFVNTTDFDKAIGLVDEFFQSLEDED
ncbi:MAG: DUF2007 domain-containing protein [Bacteroidales bacterium]